MTLRFRCGHLQKIDPDKTPSPSCAVCGEIRVARAIGVGTPQITGCATGPLVNSQALDAIDVRAQMRTVPDAH